MRLPAIRHMFGECQEYKGKENFRIYEKDIRNPKKKKTGPHFFQFLQFYCFWLH